MLALLIPVALSFAILQLSWRYVYWRDSNHDPRAVSEDLGILQIAAKAHEVLMVLSLSDLVLHYLRQGLSSPAGLPFGLFTSAYSVALGSQPVSFSFFYALKSLCRRTTIQWRSLALAAFLLTSTLLGLAVGPSSAIVLIPRLDWWPSDKFFLLYENTHDYNRKNPSTFTMYIPKLLSPSIVDASSLPLYADCLHDDYDANKTCPFAGFSDLSASMNFSAINDNVTTGSPLQRVIATNMANDGESVVASTWTTNYVLTNYMSLTFDPFYLKAAHVNPNTIQCRTNDDSVMSPLVNVFCEQQYANVFVRNVSNLDRALLNFAGSINDSARPSGTIDIRTIWNETVLAHSNTTQVAFVEDSSDVITPSHLLAFAYVPTTEEGEEANVSMCGIAASWEPSKMSVLVSGTVGTVISNFTWDKHIGG